MTPGRPSIPDKTLLDFVEAEHELVSLPGYGTVSCSDLGTFGEDMARELLALREAARLIFDGMSGTWAEVDPPTLDVIRALLPKESP